MTSDSISTKVTIKQSSDRAFLLCCGVNLSEKFGEYKIQWGLCIDCGLDAVDCDKVFKSCTRHQRKVCHFTEG